MNPFRRLRLLAELVGAVDGIPDDRLELAAAAARRAADPSAPCAQDPVSAVANLGASVYAKVPCSVVLTFLFPDGRQATVGIEYDGKGINGIVKGDETPWQAILKALREGLGQKGTPLPTATLDAFRDAVESWSYTGSCRGDHPDPPCKDPACARVRGAAWGN